MAAKREKFTEVAAAELDRRGYRVVRGLRQVGICHWLLVRDVNANQLLEAECYDKSLTNLMLLISYRNRIQALPKQLGRHSRFPQHWDETDRLVFFIRRHIAGEPLHTVLLRPGGDSQESCRRVVGSVCELFRDLIKHHIETLKPLLPNIFVADNGEVLADALTVGPWITVSAADRLLGPLTEESLSVTDQAKLFARRLYVRLLTGSHTPSDAVLARVRQRMAGDRRALTALSETLADPMRPAWIDTDLGGPRSGAGLPWLRIGMAAGAVALFLLAQAEHRRRSAVEWQGQVGPFPDLTAGAVEAAGDVNDAAPTPPPDPIAETVAGQAVRLARLGRFAEALDLLDQRQNRLDLGQDEVSALRDARNEVERLLDNEHRRVLTRVAELREAGRHRLALAELGRWLRVAPQGPYAQEVAELVREIQADREAAAADVAARDAAEKADREADRQRFATVERLRQHTYADPRTLAAARRFARDVRTPQLARFAATVAAIADAESRLLADAIAVANGPDCSRALTAIAKALHPRVRGRIDTIDDQGLTEIRPETVRQIGWNALEPNEMLALFQAVGKVRAASADHRWRMLLFALGRGLWKEAEALADGLDGDGWQPRVTEALRYRETAEALRPTP